MSLPEVAEGAAVHIKMKIITCSITIEELNELARDQFGDFVKAVVDEKKGIMVVGGELHADEEALLVEEGSRQKDLWGVNLYPAKPKEERITSCMKAL